MQQKATFHNVTAGDTDYRPGDGPHGGGRGSHALRGSAECKWDYRTATARSNTALQLYTYLLTPWSRVLLEKLNGSADSQEIPRIFGTRKFITVLRSARHLSLS